MKVKSLDADVVRISFAISNVVPNDIIHTEQNFSIVDIFDNINNSQMMTFTIL
jgi:hypothetical protein